MYINSFRVKNFKIHKDSEIEMFPITVLVGPNSGGKSSLLDALVNYSMVCRGELAEAFNDFPYSYNALRHHGASNTARIRYEVLMGKDKDSATKIQHTIEFSQDREFNQEPRYTIHNESLSVGNSIVFSRSDDVNTLNIRGLDISSRSVFAAIRRATWPKDFEEKNPDLSHCASHISRIGRYRLDSGLLEKPGKVQEIDPGTDASATKMPWLSYRGDDIAAVLYFLQETKNPILEKITERVGSAIESFEGFSFKRFGSDRVGMSAKFSDSRSTVVAPNLSVGCLHLIGLITALLTPNRPNVICIEEPENGLTPKGTRAFYETVREVSKEDNPVQVLMTSHSPFVIVDAWNGDERDFIYQCSPNNGSSNVRKFSNAVAGGGALRADRTLGLKLAEEVMDGFRG